MLWLLSTSIVSERGCFVALAQNDRQCRVRRRNYSRLVTGSRVVTTPGNGIGLSKATGQASDGGDEPHAEGNHRERSPMGVPTMRSDTTSQDSIRRQSQPSANGRGINGSDKNQKK